MTGPGGRGSGERYRLTSRHMHSTPKQDIRHGGHATPTKLPLSPLEEALGHRQLPSGPVEGGKGPPWFTSTQMLPCRGSQAVKLEAGLTQQVIKGLRKPLLRALSTPRGMAAVSLRRKRMWALAARGKGF